MAFFVPKSGFDQLAAAEPEIMDSGANYVKSKPSEN
jgi:hypothetical protein